MKTIRLLAAAITLLGAIPAFASDGKSQATMQAKIDAVAVHHQMIESQARADGYRLDAELKRINVDQTQRVYDIRNRTFARQLWYDPIILAVVILLVSGGVWLSYLHFREAVRNGDHKASSIEVSKEGLKINSPVIGLLMLFVSLGFFYLYLIEVYRIQELRQETRPPVQEISEPKAKK